MGFPFDCISNFIFVEEELKPADIILVPGGSYSELMERAAELYKMGLAPYILPSGHYNPRVGEYSSEWEFLKTVGVKLGVPEDRILREDKAAHTFDNARLSLKVIEEKGLIIKRAILVCKAYHSRRALLTYQTCFPKEIEFCVAPIHDKRDINRDNWFLDEDKIKKVMGEVTKIGKYFENEIVKLYENYR